MKKIKTMFKRDMLKKPSLVMDEVNPGCEWVFNGESIATKKYDGSCCKIEGGKFYKRREVKKDKPMPVGFILEELDKNTGKSVGWVEVLDLPENKWFLKALENSAHMVSSGTFEAVGQGFQGDVENVGEPRLIKHSDANIYPNCPRDYNGLKQWFADKDIEGIVFHHKDGRMAKIKKKDFGLKRQ